MIAVRRFCSDDHDAILALVDGLSEWFDERARRNSIPIDLKHQDGFVALLEGSVVGFITLYVAEGRLNIGWLAVRRDLHGQGIGSLLLSQAEEHGRQLDLEEIATYTLGDGVDYEPYQRTRQFYFKNGFQVYQRNKTDNPSCPEEIRIHKNISRHLAAGDAAKPRV